MVLQLLNELNELVSEPEMRLRIWTARHELIKFIDRLDDNRVRVAYMQLLSGRGTHETRISTTR